MSDCTTPPADEPNRYTPSACPGARAPHARLPDGRSLFDAFNFEWTLLVLGSPPCDVRAFEEAAAALRLDLQVVRNADAALRAVYDAPLALIRPDQVVAWRWHDARLAADVLAMVTGNAQTTNLRPGIE